MILYLIPARGGSKRLPGKNLKQLAGVPLVAHAIRRARGAARLVGGDYRVVVSTDSEDIASVAREWGADVLIRPARLAEDTTSAESVAHHAITTIGGVQTLVWVQPTSPLATAADLVAAIRQHEQNRFYSAIAVAPDREEPCGAAYVCDATQGYATWAMWNGIEVPLSHSVDINTQDDFDVAAALLAARQPAPIEIAGRKIGPGHPCFVIAEAGVNHDGHGMRAYGLIEAAAAARADAIKFQTFDADELAEPGPHRDMLAKLQLGRAWWPGLKKYAEDRGLIFLSSVFGPADVETIDAFVPAHKIPSGELTNDALLRAVAATRKPVLLSTGMATMREIAHAMDVLGDVPLVLLHCISEYPTFQDDANLRAIQTLRQAFNVPVGWSDHTFGRFTLGPAIALGASVIEKHVSLDVTADGPDHLSSVTPMELALAVDEIRHHEAGLGSGEKVPTPGERETAKVARRINGLRRNPCSPVA